MTEHPEPNLGPSRGYRVGQSLSPRDIFLSFKSRTNQALSSVFDAAQTPALVRARHDPGRQLNISMEAVDTTQSVG